MKTDLFLIRHGQPELKDALLGSTDSPLSNLGWLQLEKTAQQLEQLDYLLSSPLKRCAEFAQQFATNNNYSLIINDNWRECHFGDWDGLKYKDLYKKHPKASQGFFDNPNQNMPKNAESLPDFSLRIESSLMQLLEQQKGRKIALFTHAGVIRTIIAWCLDMDYSQGLQFKRFAIDYASITQLSIYHNEAFTADKESDKASLYPQLISLNQTFTI